MSASSSLQFSSYRWLTLTVKEFSPVFAMLQGVLRQGTRDARGSTPAVALTRHRSQPTSTLVNPKTIRAFCILQTGRIGPLCEESAPYDSNRDTGQLSQSCITKVQGFVHGLELTEESLQEYQMMMGDSKYTEAYLQIPEDHHWVSPNLHGMDRVLTDDGQNIKLLCGEIEAGMWTVDGFYGRYSDCSLLYKKGSISLKTVDNEPIKVGLKLFVFRRAPSDITPSDTATTQG